MKKEETIRRYGEAAWEKHLQQSRDWNAQNPKEKRAIAKKWHAQHRERENAKSMVWYVQHRDEGIARNKKWREDNPAKVKASNQEASRKGGKYYVHQLEYQRTGLQGERKKIRVKHAWQYRAIKEATPNSQIHHEWIPGTTNFRGVALVETEAHRHGIIKVIKVLEGQITLFTEEEIRGQVGKQ